MTPYLLIHLRSNFITIIHIFPQKKVNYINKQSNQANVSTPSYNKIIYIYIYKNEHLDNFHTVRLLENKFKN